ncbi:MAG: glycosyltransferase family 9 protein, partial [Opitutaceae bacterium]
SAVRQGLPSGVEVSENLPLPALAVQLAQCRLFLGHDSGLSHLAAAVGTPCVLLFGPTDPAMWAPPGGHVRVIRRGETLDAIAIEEVLAAVDPAIDRPASLP